MKSLIAENLNIPSEEDTLLWRSNLHTHRLSWAFINVGVVSTPQHTEIVAKRYLVLIFLSKLDIADTLGSM